MAAMWFTLVPKAIAAINPLMPPLECDFVLGQIHFNCIPAYISMVTVTVLGFTTSISLLMLMYNGIRYMLGPVTEGSSDSSKKGILYSIVGLIVSLMAYVIIDTVVMAVTQ